MLSALRTSLLPYLHSYCRHSHIDMILDVAVAMPGYVVLYGVFVCVCK
jgi:hypothetical protein